jgi:hypothetical protein
VWWLASREVASGFAKSGILKCLAHYVFDSSRRLGRSFFRAGSLWGVTGPPTLARADEAQQVELKYGWKTGEKHYFKVTIQSDRGDYWVNHTGTPSFTVTSADADGMKLTFVGSVSESKKAKPGKRIFFRPSFPRSGLSGVGISSRGQTMSINRFGEVISSKGSSQLPYLLGNLSQLLLEPLSKDGKTNWSVGEDISIGTSNSRFPRPSFLGRHDGTSYKARQDTIYTVEKSDGKFVVIKKTFALKSLVTEGGKPMFEITGKGVYVFDHVNGSPVSLKYEQTVFTRKGGNTTEIPVAVTIRVLDEAERAKIAATAEAARKKAAAPISGDELTELVADLKSDQ